MYWLLSEGEKESVRKDLESLTEKLSIITGQPTQADQLFPFVGRKDIRKAEAVLSVLMKKDGVALDPFSGSGIFAYAATLNGQTILANEWDPYTWRMSTAPWRLPKRDDIRRALEQLEGAVGSQVRELYSSICPCGAKIYVDSVFFDRVPFTYENITPHERLGKNGETVTFRGKYKCRKCGATEKFFGSEDYESLERTEKIKLSDLSIKIFDTELIENSRININKNFLRYGNFFPYRSQVALDIMWQGISRFDESSQIQSFFQEAFLSIIPQAKFKDYRSKSQDLHAPEKQLREVNLWFRFLDAIEKRRKRLSEYGFQSASQSPINHQDFREFLSSQPDESAALVFTDPPWTDGNAYFEKSQLYHPWLGYSLMADHERLSKEVVVTDAPSRAALHDEDRWWSDIEEFFSLSEKKTVPLGYLAVYFRPIPANRWLQNLNRLKYEARKAGFEPLLTIDAASKDPSMRIQQSASFVFSSDLVFVFLRLPSDLRRQFIKGHDLDYLAFKAGSTLQQTLRSPFMRLEWDQEFYRLAQEEGLYELALPAFSDVKDVLFERYIREVTPGKYLVKPDTPFNGQLFDVPGEERLFSFVPAIVSELTENNATFSYDAFLLKLAAFVENGTRMLIQSIESIDINRMLYPYAEPVQNGRMFQKRAIPELNSSVKRLHDLDPYEFERFTGILLEAQGFTQVAVMGGAGDRGVDLVAVDPSGKSTIVQCKRYLNNVGSDPIQRLHSFAVTRNVQRRIVITTAGFTRDATDEAKRTNTELVDGSELQRLVAAYLPDFLDEG